MCRHQFATIAAKASQTGEVSPEGLVNVLAANTNSQTRLPESDPKAATVLRNVPSVVGVPGEPSAHTILGLLGDLPTREASYPPTWGRWSSRCHWRCKRCTERLGFLLTRQVLAVLTGLATDVPRSQLGTLTISPPPGIQLSELRTAVEGIVRASCEHAIWGIKGSHAGRAIAYMLTIATDPKQLEQASRTAVSGGSRSARFSRLRGSDMGLSPPSQVLAFNLGHVLRHLTGLGFPPPTLKPGYRFGASGAFAPLLADALAILRREHPCRVGHHRSPERAEEISPEASGATFRACRWCKIPVDGQAQRHSRCSTRVWRAKLALRSELGPEDLDGFLYRVEVLVESGLSEPEAMLRAVTEFIGRDAEPPRDFVEVVSLPMEPVPPGYRPARSSRMGGGIKGRTT